MTATSKHVDVAYRGTDLSISFTYTPPAGEDRDGLEITAALFTVGSRKVEANAVTFDPATGAVLASWVEVTTAALVGGSVYEARFVRNRDGDTRVFFIRKVEVR